MMRDPQSFDDQWGPVDMWPRLCVVVRLEVVSVAVSGIKIQPRRDCLHL